MNFENVNRLNVRLNIISGNLLPTNKDESEFSIKLKIYKVFTWLLQLIFLIVMIIAIPYAPIENIMQNSVICMLMIYEITFVVGRIYQSKKLMLEFIQHFNNILAEEDELMKNVVEKTLKPVILPLTLYCITGASTLTIWAVVPYYIAFKQKKFLYEDIRVSIVLSKQPFTVEIFVFAETLVWFAALGLFLKKVAADIYLVHVVLLMTSQYRYISVKLAMIFRGETENDEENQKQSDLYTDLWTTLDSKNEIIALCNRYNTVIYIATILKKVLALNFSVIYMNNVFRISYFAVMIISAMIDGYYLEAYLLLIYTISSLIQLYILCYCSQQLLDTVSSAVKSRRVTDKTFHEKWYLFGASQKYMLLFLMMGTKLECDLSAFQNFALNLSSFMTILNQSYSIALLFLKFKMK